MLSAQAVQKAGVPRSDLFEYAARLPYASSQYFKRISMAARNLNLDYAQACRLEADQTKSPEVRGLLLRMSGSLLSRENEREFIRREAEVIGESYSNEYARQAPMSWASSPIGQPRVAWLGLSWPNSTTNGPSADAT